MSVNARPRVRSSCAPTARWRCRAPPTPACLARVADAARAASAAEARWSALGPSGGGGGAAGPAGSRASSRDARCRAFAGTGNRAFLLTVPASRHRSACRCVFFVAPRPRGERRQRHAKDSDPLLERQNQLARLVARPEPAARAAARRVPLRARAEHLQRHRRRAGDPGQVQLHDRPGRSNAGWSSRMSRCVVRNAMRLCTFIRRGHQPAASHAELRVRLLRTRSSSSSGASTGRPLSVGATPSRSNMLAARRH